MRPHRPIAVVVGVGVGVGGAVAARFAAEGFAVGVIARNQTYSGADKLTAALQRLVAVTHAGDDGAGGGADRAPRVTELSTSDGSSLVVPTAAAAAGKEEEEEEEKQQQSQQYRFAGVRADAGVAAEVEAAIQRLRSLLGGGAVRVLVYNAGARKFGTEGLLELNVEELERFWRTNCLGALHCMRAVLPGMLGDATTTQAADTDDDRDSSAAAAAAADEEAAAAAAAARDPRRGAVPHRGTIILTGATASVRGSAGAASFAVGKFGLRALAQSAAREFGPQGVHVAHVILDGAVALPILRKRAPPDTPLLDPAAVADVYWHLHAQHPSAWVHELDLRPAAEPMAARL